VSALGRWAAKSASGRTRADDATRPISIACALVLLTVAIIPPAPPSSILWTAPSILVASMLIAWAAESAQFFIAQGFALAILAWLQTLPEFAVEAVLAWKQQVPLLMANLTGALRLLTGLGWPMIYCTAALFHRSRGKGSLGPIMLADEHCVEVVGLLAAMSYLFVVWWKASLTLVDAGVLIAVYIAYLVVLRRMPAAEAEGIEDLEFIPRTIVTAARGIRTTAIVILFVAGGALIYYMAEPFLASLLAVSASLGVSNFVFVQWVAPFVSEFPEKVSAFYWARTVERASMALMNMVSSNINQWTLLAAMLPITYSLSRGVATPIPLDDQQELELLMTLGQSLLGAIFLADMRLVWWEAAGLFGLWALQFGLSPVRPGPGVVGFLAQHIHSWVTVAYWVWAAIEIARIFGGHRRPRAFYLFGRMWSRYVRAVR
jgi:cation:H+ antiporter